MNPKCSLCLLEMIYISPEYGNPGKYICENLNHEFCEVKRMTSANLHSIIFNNVAYCACFERQIVAKYIKENNIIDFESKTIITMNQFMNEIDILFSENYLKEYLLFQ